MPEKNKNVMIIAGELSGDLIGADLIAELKKRDPGLNICGIGGDNMQKAGMEIIFHIKDMAFLGFTEVIKHLPFIRRVQNDLIKTIKERKIKLTVLIDYPGFNLSIARKMKRLGLRVIYYVSPQVWAWGQGRVKKIKKYVDKMIVLFPFEEEFYMGHQIDVEFSGHPLLDRINNYHFISRAELYDKLILDKSKEILLLMPGSRENEVEKLFPEMMLAAEKICNEFNLQVVVASSANIDEKKFKTLVPGDYKVTGGYTYDLMNNSLTAIVKSGTSTLEAALFGLPMVIVYKTSQLTYLIGRNLIKVQHIGMANIISGERIIPELIQKDVTAENIHYELSRILSDKNIYNEMKRKLQEVKLKLGEKGASARAAGFIYNELQKT